MKRLFVGLDSQNLLAQPKKACRRYLHGFSNKLTCSSWHVCRRRKIPSECWSSSYRCSSTKSRAGFLPVRREPSTGDAHTDCRMAVADEASIHSTINEQFGVDTSSLEFHTVSNQRHALNKDVARIRSYPLLQKGASVAGAMYNVSTGQI
jgi:hypothetical protein